MPWFPSGIDFLMGLGLAYAGASLGKTTWQKFLYGFLLASGGGLVRDILFGITPYLIERPFYLLSIFWGVLLYLFFPSRVVALTLDFVGSLYFIWAGGERVLEHGRTISDALIGGGLTGLAGGLVAGFLVHLLHPEKAGET